MSMWTPEAIEIVAPSKLPKSVGYLELITVGSDSVRVRMSNSAVAVVNSTFDALKADSKLSMVEFDSISESGTFVLASGAKLPPYALLALVLNAILTGKDILRWQEYLEELDWYEIMNQWDVYQEIEDDEMFAKLILEFIKNSFFATSKVTSICEIKDQQGFVKNSCLLKGVAVNIA
ncbi:MAG: hypothetical protein ACRCXZ_02880 [Patescibacteria group bacterium]